MVSVHGVWLILISSIQSQLNIAIGLYFIENSLKMKDVTVINLDDGPPLKKLKQG